MRPVVLTLLFIPLMVPADEIAERQALEPAVSGADLAAATRPVPRVVDELDLDRTEITGNQELPRVLYIVPWKSSELGDLVGRPVNTLLDEVLAPVDREVFVRQVGYYRNLHAGPDGQTGEDPGDSQ